MPDQEQTAKEGTWYVLQRALAAAKDDLPARLRLRADHDGWRDNAAAGDMRAAADEIERLRADLAAADTDLDAFILVPR